MIEFLEEDKLITRLYPLTSSPTFTGTLHTASTTSGPSPEPISEGMPRGRKGILTIGFQ
jgi:hypothetical protein